MQPAGIDHRPQEVPHSPCTLAFEPLSKNSFNMPTQDQPQATLDVLAAADDEFNTHEDAELLPRKDADLHEVFPRPPEAPAGPPAREPLAATHKPVGHAFRGDIEAMRGLAVGVVILYHFYPDSFTGGFVGVDVFFAISGFVISLMLSGWFASGTYSLQKFYAFRSRRLLPASTAALIGTLIASAMQMDYISFADVQADGWWAGTFRANYRFLFINTDYGAQRGTVSPLLHFWSLAVEEQFYVLFPLLAWALYRMPRAVRTAVMGITIIASLIHSQALLGKGEQMTAFYMLSSRWWEMAIGYVAYSAHDMLQADRLQPIRRALSYVGAALVAYSVYATHIANSFPGLAAGWSVVGTAALLAAGGAAPVNERMANSSVLRWLGKRSYSLYLWHWPVIVLGGFEGADLGGLCKAVFFVLGLAYASERLVERPFRTVKSIWKGIGIGLACLALTGVVWVATGAAVRPAAYTGVVVAEDTSNVTRRAAFLSHVQVLNKSLDYTTFPAGMYPPLDHLSIGYTYDTELKGCNAHICNFPLPPRADGKPRKVLMLTGDSHGAHWFVQIRAVAYALGMDMKAAIRSSCVFTTEAVARTYGETREVVRESCFKTLRENIEAAKHVDLVVVSRMFSQSPNVSASAQIELHRQREAANKGKRVVTWYMGDSPAGSWGSALVNAKRPIVQHPKSIVLGGNAQLAVLSDQPNMWFTSSVPLFCVPRGGSLDCPTVVGNTVVYKDVHHLTGAMGHRLASRMVGFLQQLHPDVWQDMCDLVDNEPLDCQNWRLSP